MAYLQIPQLECLLCGHKWIPRKLTYARGYYPNTCPKCRSFYWDLPLGSPRDEFRSEMDRAHGGISVTKRGEADGKAT